MGSSVTNAASARDAARTTFIDACGLGRANVTPLAPDASFRRYFRVSIRNEVSYMLMDAPPPKENVVPFVTIARHLQRLRLRPPRIERVDAAQGFVLLEDLGDRTFTRLLDSGHDPDSLYDQAVDVLITLHRNRDALAVDVDPYSADKLIAEAQLFVDWFCPFNEAIEIDRRAEADWREAWQTAIAALPEIRPTLVLRDFHVDNLMRLDDGAGVDHCGLLDFQDAVIGSPAYDLVSLLEDARRDVAAALVKRLRARYESGMELDLRDHAADQARHAFNAWYNLLGAQRHAKVLGIFTRLSARDGKHHYKNHLPRVERLFKKKLAERELASVNDWCRRYAPRFANLPAVRPVRP